MLSLYRFILIILFIPCVLIFANTLIPGYGHTLYFDGSDDKVVVPYSEELNSQQYSIMFWIKPKLDESTTNPNGTGILSLKGKYGKKRGYYFIITDDKKIRFRHGNESEWISIKSIEEVGYNQWIHLASTFDGEKAAFYINGELINSIQSEYSLNNQEDLIIGYINQNYDYFKGYIEEISLWDRALSSEEIINNMNTLFSKEEENLVAYWHMDNVSNDNTKLANFLNDNHTGSLHGYTTQLNAPEFSWNKSEFKQLFFAIEDSLTHFNLYGYASNSEFFIPFISQNIRFGDLYITNPENMKLSFLSETNFNSERIQSSFPIEGTTPELISENGSLMFSYYLTSGDSTDFISVLDTALIFISSVNDAPTVVNPENTKDLLPVLVGSDNNLGTLISDIIENLIIHDPDHLLIDFEGGSTSFSHTQGDNYGIAVVAPLNNDDQLNEGNWEYLLNSSDSWTNLDLEEGGNYSLLLGQNDLIRYVPYSGTSGSRELTFRIWDQFNGEIGTYINLLENSGISDSSNDDISTHLEIIEGPPIAGFGNAFKFDGDGDYIEIHSLTSEFPLLQTNSWTVEMWVNSNVLDHEYTYLFGMREKNDNGSSDGYFAFGITNNSSSYPHKLFYYPNENNSHGINTNQTPFEHGVWNHLAVSFDGNTGSITLYANGISENTISSRASGFANGFSLIGAVPLSDDGTAYPHSFEGAIDEVRVWNYVRTSTQINNHKYTIYQSKPDGLIGHYRFDNINLNDETTKDDGGNNYNGKLNGDLIDNYLTTLDWVAEPELYFNPSTHGNFITLTGDKFSSFTQSTNGWKVNGNFIMSNGIAQYFKTNSDNTLPYTISIWIYPYEQTCTQYHENVIWGFYTQDGSNLSFLSIGCAYNASSCSHCNTNFRPKKLYFSPNGSTGYWTVNDVIYLNEWNYITITGDGVNQTQLYINGVEVNNYYTSDNPDAILTNFPIYMELSDAYIFSIGQDWDGAISDFHTSQHFTGGISEFVIWDSNLSVKEINEAMLGNIRTNNLLAHYLFNEGTEYNTSTKTEGITIVDNSGHSDFPDQNSPSRNGILYYDSIVNTVPLTKFFEVNEDQTLAENLQGYDEDSNIEEHGLNYYIITPPENGIASVVDATAGSISYTPNPNFNGTDILGYKISDNAGNSDSTITYIKVNPVNDAPVITKESITLSELGNSEILGSENIGQRVKDIISSFNIVTDVDIPFYIDISEVTGIAITSSTNLSANKWKYCFNCTDSSVYSDASSWNDLGTVSTSNALLLGPDDRIAFDSNGVSSDGSASLKFNLWDMTDGSSVNTYVNITSTGGTTAISTSTITVEQPIVEACVLNIPNIELPFLIPTDGSTSESITIQDGFDFFRIHLGGDDSFIVKWELDGSDTTGVDKFSFWGNSSVTIGEESDTLTLKLDLGTENDPGIIIHGNHDCTGYQLIQISMEINESFSYGGFTFSTNPDPFVFTYNSQEDQFEMSGTALFSYQGDSLTVGFKDFQNDNAPGMIIKNGDLEKLEVFLNTEFEIFGLDLTIDDVTFEYIHDDNYYAMWGEVDLIIENTDIIDISMGGSDNPGIIFQNGQLNYLNLDVISDIQAGKFKFETKDLDLIYTGVSNSRVNGNSINNSATAEYQITGEVKLVLTDGFTVDVTLGDEEDGLPGIDIIESNGSTTFELDFFDLTITSLELGAIDFKEVEFTYSNENGVEDFFAELDVSFSSKFEVDGTLEFEINNQGVFELDSLSIDWCVVGDNPGIEILGTGLELVHMGGGGSDFSDPANLSVNADVGLVLADQFEIDGTEVTLARSDDEVTITPNSLVLNADVLLGAYLANEESAHCTTPWDALLARADMEISLDWTTGVYKISGDIDVPTDPGFSFNENLILTSNSLSLNAKAEVLVPSDIEVIGGWELGEIDFAVLLNYGSGTNPQLQFPSYFAAWTKLIWPIGEVGLAMHMVPNEFIFLGADDVEEVQNETSRTYGGNEQGIISHTFTLDKLFTTGISMDLNWNKEIILSDDQNPIVIYIEGPSGANFSFQQLVKNSSTGNIDLIDLIANHNLQLEDTTTSVSLILSSESYYNSENQDDLSDLQLGAYTLEFHYPPTSENADLVLEASPHLHYKLPSVDIQSIDLSDDGIVNLSVSYWSTPHLIDSTIIYFYVINDSANGYNGTMFTKSNELSNYDADSGGSLIAQFDPSELSNHEYAHSAFKPYSFYASIHDGINRPSFSDISSKVHIIPPVYGQTYKQTESGLEILPNIPVFIDIDQNGVFTSYEKFEDVDGSGTFTEGDILINDVNQNGQFDNYVDFIDHTDNLGSFSFFGLDQGFEFEVGIVVPYGMKISENSPMQDQHPFNYHGIPLAIYFYLEDIIEEN